MLTKVGCSGCGYDFNTNGGHDERKKKKLHCKHLLCSKCLEERIHVDIEEKILTVRCPSCKVKTTKPIRSKRLSDQKVSIFMNSTTLDQQFTDTQKRYQPALENTAKICISFVDSIIIISSVYGAYNVFNGTILDAQINLLQQSSTHRISYICLLLNFCLMEYSMTVMHLPQWTVVLDYLALSCLMLSSLYGVDFGYFHVMDQFLVLGIGAFKIPLLTVLLLIAEVLNVSIHFFLSLDLSASVFSPLETQLTLAIDNKAQETISEPEPIPVSVQNMVKKFSKNQPPKTQKSAKPPPKPMPTPTLATGSSDTAAPEIKVGGQTPSATSAKSKQGAPLSAGKAGNPLKIETSVLTPFSSLERFKQSDNYPLQASRDISRDILSHVEEDESPHSPETSLPKSNTVNSPITPYYEKEDINDDTPLLPDYSVHGPFSPERRQRLQTKIQQSAETVGHTTDGSISVDFSVVGDTVERKKGGSPDSMRGARLLDMWGSSAESSSSLVSPRKRNRKVKTSLNTVEESDSDSNTKKERADSTRRRRRKPTPPTNKTLTNSTESNEKDTSQNFKNPMESVNNSRNSAVGVKKPKMNQVTPEDRNTLKLKTSVLSTERDDSASRRRYRTPETRESQESIYRSDEKRTKIPSMTRLKECIKPTSSFLVIVQLNPKLSKKRNIANISKCLAIIIEQCSACNCSLSIAIATMWNSRLNWLSYSGGNEKGSPDSNTVSERFKDMSASGEKPSKAVLIEAHHIAQQLLALTSTPEAITSGSKNPLSDSLGSGFLLSDMRVDIKAALTYFPTSTDVVIICDGEAWPFKPQPVHQSFSEVAFSPVKTPSSLSQWAHFRSNYPEKVFHFVAIGMDH